MGFNVGFSLWNNDFTKLHNMSLIEDYVQFEATLNYYGWDGAKTFNRTHLNMIPCSVDDFYPSHEAYEWAEFWPYIVPFYMCLEKYEDITLWSNDDRAEFVSLDIRLVRCTNKTSCKNDTEINDFID